LNFFKGLAKKRFLDINNNFNNSLKIEIMEEKLVEIKGIVAEVSEMEPEEIDNDGLLKDDYGIDSMRMIEILATLEKNYGIKINQEDLSEMTTVHNIYKIVNKYTKWS
jgi:acyl carrier protein